MKALFYAILFLALPVRAGTPYLSPEVGKNLSQIIKTGIFADITPAGFTLTAINIQKHQIVMKTSPDCTIVLTQNKGDYRTRWFGVQVNCKAVCITGTVSNALYAMALVADSGFSRSAWQENADKALHRNQNLHKAGRSSSPLKSGFVPLWFSLLCAALGGLIVVVTIGTWTWWIVRH